MAHKPFNPTVKSIRDIFSISKPYFIDIYQREYKWGEDQVMQLLRDIQRHHDKKSPYFINTFLTSVDDTNSNKAIIDGQQRITTFLLILMVLHNIVQDIEAQTTTGELQLIKSHKIKDLITKSNDFGDAIQFSISNDDRKEVLDTLLNRRVSREACSETETHLQENYNKIKSYLEKIFKENIDQLQAYIKFILDEIYTIEIEITNKKDIATIFEIVNDRGLPLQSHEILKAKLLGVLSGDQKEEANKVWESLLKNYYLKDQNIDDFFRDYIRARFNKKNLADIQNNNYHRFFDTDKDILQEFGNLSDENIIFNKIVYEIKFYAILYLDLKTGKYPSQHVIYNQFLDQDIQYTLIMSATSSDDSKEVIEKKVDIIARSFEKWYVIYTLLKVFDSRGTLSHYTSLVHKFRMGQDANIIKGLFDELNFKDLKDKEIIGSNINSLAELFDSFSNLSQFSFYDHGFVKYILMRFELVLKDIFNKPSRINSFEDFMYHARKRGNAKDALHVEHIYADNDENWELFNEDWDSYNSSRNQLGVLLLLLGSHNQSSGNDLYRDKIKLYEKSNFIWNELLSNHIVSLDLKKMPQELNFDYYIKPNSKGLFPKDKIEERQKIVLQFIKYIWCS